MMNYIYACWLFWLRTALIAQTCESPSLWLILWPDTAWEFVCFRAISNLPSNTVKSFFHRFEIYFRKLSRLCWILITCRLWFVSHHREKEQFRIFWALVLKLMDWKALVHPVISISNKWRFILPNFKRINSVRFMVLLHVRRLDCLQYRGRCACQG